MRRTIQLPPARSLLSFPATTRRDFSARRSKASWLKRYPRSEIVVVDDGSTDHTVEVARMYDAVRCVSQPNQGQGAARNEGLEHISGEFVVFLDSDDRLLPHAFEVGLRCFAAHPEVAFVAGRYVGLGSDGMQRRTRQDPVVERNHYLKLLASNYIWMPGTVMFRTAIVRQAGGFKSTVCGAEDYDLYLRIARNHRIWCHDQVIAEYRQHDTSMSRKPMLMMRSALSVLHGQRDAVKGDPRRSRPYAGHQTLAVCSMASS